MPPGVSLITQILYAVVFCTRYIDIFYETIRWNFFFKIFYISSSLYIIAIMQWVFPRTREREISWKIGAGILGGSLLLSPFVMLIFEKWWSFSQWLWDFSEILEAVCVLPQLVLLRQTSVPTVINSFYLVTLGLYRLLYVLNWIWRGLDPTSRSPNAVSVIFGVIQTALFVDFFWVRNYPAPGTIWQSTRLLTLRNSATTPAPASGYETVASLTPKTTDEAGSSAVLSGTMCASTLMTTRSRDRRLVTMAKARRADPRGPSGELVEFLCQPMRGYTSASR